MSYKKYLVEFIGTFYLVFTIGAVLLLGGDGVINAIAIGFALMVMVYSGGYISGGHYNPAVSLAAVIRNSLPREEFIPYVISQTLGGTTACLMINHFSGHLANYEGCAFNIFPMIVGEFLFTFALCYVVLMTTTSKAKENSYYGFAIGATVSTGIFTVGSILCHGAFNPAVAVSLGMMHLACWQSVFVTIGANLLGAICAGFIFKYLNKIKIDTNY
ncbi:aquaporin [bacterium]|nr:aquaporin [bacterium]